MPGMHRFHRLLVVCLAATLLGCGTANNSSTTMPTTASGRVPGDGTAFAWACGTLGEVVAGFVSYPGPAVPPDGGDDAVAVYNWKRSMVAPIRDLWSWAHEYSERIESDQKFLTDLRSYYDAALPQTSLALDATVQPPMVSDELHRACDKHEMAID
jgi:hypothetical protein